MNLSIIHIDMLSQSVEHWFDDIIDITSHLGVWKVKQRGCNGIFRCKVAFGQN